MILGQKKMMLISVNGKEFYITNYIIIIECNSHSTPIIHEFNYLPMHFYLLLEIVDLRFD